jgi:hypothetical protein
MILGIILSSTQEIVVFHYSNSVYGLRQTATHTTENIMPSSEDDSEIQLLFTSSQRLEEAKNYS